MGRAYLYMRLINVLCAFASQN
jgi:hypothetical protein